MLQCAAASNGRCKRLSVGSERAHTVAACGSDRVCATGLAVTTSASFCSLADGLFLVFWRLSRTEQALALGLAPWKYPTGERSGSTLPRRVKLRRHPFLEKSPADVNPFQRRRNSRARRMRRAVPVSNRSEPGRQCAARLLHCEDWKSPGRGGE
jgi:hypothetical protein